MQMTKLLNSKSIRYDFFVLKRVINTKSINKIKNIK